MRCAPDAYTRLAYRTYSVDLSCAELMRHGMINSFLTVRTSQHRPNQSKQGVASGLYQLIVY